MKWLLLFISLISTAQAKPIVVAVVDTGLDLTDPRFSKVLCKTGHKDFTGAGIEDHHGHGTHIAGLIKKYAKNANYCLLIVKYYDKSPEGWTSPNHSNFLQAEIYAIKHADVINISGGGDGFIHYEYATIEQYPNKVLIVAAGNDNENLDDKNYAYYPASYRSPNEIIVGSKHENGVKAPTSNYGRGLVWEVGSNVLSTLPNGVGIMSGTSQACAIHTGKYIYEKYR